MGIIIVVNVFFTLEAILFVMHSLIPILCHTQLLADRLSATRPLTLVGGFIGSIVCVLTLTVRGIYVSLYHDGGGDSVPSMHLMDMMFR